MLVEETFKAFAGAKAGVEVGAELRYQKLLLSLQEMIKQYAKTLPCNMG